jgi:hypothetical protein
MVQYQSGMFRDGTGGIIVEPTKCAARTVFAVRLFALGLIGLALMPARAPAATAPEPSSAVKARTESDYGKLPLSFEANQGQTDSQVNG